MTLRPYQHRAISDLRERYRDRPLLCLPTGAGKTTVAAEIIRATVAKGNRAIFLVHRRELVDQAVTRLAEHGVKAGRILAGHPEERSCPVQVASIPTLIRRDHWPADLVIVDECAHAVSDSWTRCLGRYPDAWIIGLTATPIRLDGRGLGDIFGCIVEPVTTRELIDQGYLAEPEVFAPPVDLKGVRVTRGDYAIPELAERMNKLVGSITDTWFERAKYKSTVVFAVNLDHSKRIVDAFRARDVQAEHVDYKMSHKDRANALRRLNYGTTTIVSQVMLLSEGWDMPHLECAILARPTKSLALFRQMVGRVMRPPGPVTVLDHAGNHHEHGLVTDEIDWTLDAREKTKSAPGVKSCPECFAILPAGTTVCTECGAILKPDEAEAPGVDNEGELVRLNRTTSRAEKERKYRTLVRIASGCQYKLAWARIRYRDTYGVWPRHRDIERDEYTCSGHEWETKQYGPRTVTRCGRCYQENRHAPSMD